MVRRRGPVKVDGEYLRSCARKLATAAYLARRWPQQGTRSEFAPAVSGSLLRGGLRPDEVEQIIGAAAEVGGDDEVAARVATVAGTVKAMAEGTHVTGGPRIAGITGDEYLPQTLAKWQTSMPATPRAPRPLRAPSRTSCWPSPERPATCSTTARLQHALPGAPRDGRAGRPRLELAVADWLEAQMDGIVARFTMPADVRERVLDLLRDHSGEDDVPARRQRLQERLRRVGKLYADGQQRCRVRRRAPAHPERDRQTVPTEQAVTAAETFGVLQAAWALATPDEKRGLAVALFEAIIVNTATKQIIDVVVQPAFRAWLRDWRVQ